MTTYAVLETAEHVFNVGSGFTKLDMTGFTLNRIKNIVESIEKKIDIVLKAPLKKALDYLKSAVTFITQQMYEEAFHKLDKVEDEATTAFHYSSQNEKTTANLRESISSVKLLVFSKVMRCCYDKKTKVFLPYRMLQRNIKVAISEELEKLVKDCLALSELVKSKKWFLSKAKETEIQDTVDTVLTMTYPYISEGRGWTSLNTEIARTQRSVEVKIKPQYVPEGEEDKTEVIIGTYLRDPSIPVRITIWRSRGYVIVASPHYGREVMAPFSSLEDELEASIPMRPQSLLNFYLSQGSHVRIPKL